MHSQLCLGWGKFVGGLFRDGGRTLGLPTAGGCCVLVPVENGGWFSKLLTNFIPGLFHVIITIFTSVRVLVLPTIHTTYNNKLLSLFNSY